MVNSVIVSCTSCGKKNKIAADKQHLRPKCGHCREAISLTNQAVPVVLDDQSFHDFIKSASLPVMVDFYSPTCGPCQAMMPGITSMASKFLNKYIIAKFDTSMNQRTPMLFNIRGVPSFFFFKDGELVDQVTGAAAEDVLVQKLSGMV